MEIQTSIQDVLQVAQQTRFNPTRICVVLTYKHNELTAVLKKLNVHQREAYATLEHNGVFCNGVNYCVRVLIKESDLQKASDNGDILTCQDCNNRYLQHRVHLNDRAYVAKGADVNLCAFDDNTERYLCEACESEYERCEYCGRLITSGRVSAINADDGITYFCADCADEHTWTCDDCGCVYTNDVDHYEDDDEIICGRCYNSNLANPIKRYHTSHGASLNFYNADGSIEHRDGAIYCGLEIEADGARTHRECVQIAQKIRALDPREHKLFLEHDGSLSEDGNGYDVGFEMITHPFELNAFDYIGIRDAVSIARTSGMRSHDTTTCGMHLHFSRNIFGRTQKTAYNTLLRLADFIDQYESEIINIARRGYGHYREKYEIDTDEYDTRRDALREVIPSVYDEYANRYYIINVTNQNTIEIRINRGTLNADTIKGTLHFYYNLITACRDLTSAQFYDGERIRLDNVLSYMDADAIKYMKYRNAFGYLSEDASTIASLAGCEV